MLSMLSVLSVLSMLSLLSMLAMTMANAMTRLWLWLCQECGQHGQCQQRTQRGQCQQHGQCQQCQQRGNSSPRQRRGDEGCAVGTVDIVHAVDIVRAAHAVDIVHAVHTLDIAIVIVIAKATNTRFGWPEMAIPGGGLPEQTEMAIPGGCLRRWRWRSLGGCLRRRRWRSRGIWKKIESPGNCHLRVPTRRYGYQNVQNFGANNFGFHHKSRHFGFSGTFSEKKFFQ